jgi:multiple sugar transport system substrate-binding protein
MKKLRIAMRSFADFEAALNAQIAAYRGLNPEAEIEIAACDLRGLEEAVLGDNGLRSADWDLAIFPTDWIGAAAQSNCLESLAPWMQENPLPDWPEGWPASLREPLRRGEDLYCIPWHDGPECLIYRLDLFEDRAERAAFADLFGRDLAQPITWNEFHETARFFTRPGDGRYGTLFAAYPDGHNTLYDIVLQVWSRGGELYDADGVPCLTDPIVVEAVDYYRAIIGDPLACYPKATSLDSVQSGDVFLSEKIATMVNWFGFAARCQQPGSPLRGKIGLAPIPGGRPGQSASLSNYWVIGIGAGSRNKQAAYDLLQHIASPAMDRLTALSGAVGVRLSTWTDPDVLQQVPLYQDLPRLSATARTLPFCENLPKLAEIVNQITILALGGNEPSEDILARAQNTAVEQGLRLVSVLSETSGSRLD